jgi:predicted nucleotidyltransferase
MTTIQENILDPTQSDLSSDIFIPNKKVMKTKVKYYIIDTIYKWIKLQGYEKEIIKSIHLIGSSASKNYTTTSDVDVSIETSIPAETTKKIWKLLPNGNNLPNTDHPINYYLTNNLLDVEKSVAGYNILTDKWHHEQDEKEKVFPINYAYEISKFFTAGFNSRISEYELDNKELEYLKGIKNPQDIEMSENELKKRIELKQMEIYADLDAINMGHHLLKSFRKLPFEGKKTDTILQIEIKQNSNTLNNLVYKILTDKLGFEEIFKKYEDIREKYKKEMN